MPEVTVGSRLTELTEALRRNDQNITIEKDRHKDAMKMLNDEHDSIKQTMYEVIDGSEQTDMFQSEGEQPE